MSNVPQTYPIGHFHSPIPSKEEVALARKRAELNATQTMDSNSGGNLPGLDLREQQQLTLLHSLDQYYSQLPFAETAAEYPSIGPHPRYYYDNGAYCYADGVFLFFMLRHLRPKKIIEVGSGFSSALMIDVNELFLSNKTQLTLVEPNTERLEKNLRPGDLQTILLKKNFVQDLPLELFAELGAGDILFIDSTHVSKFGSDVNYLLFEVLPRLNSGVYLHFHDIFYPFEYPDQWLTQGIYWNEAYALRAFLSNNLDYQIVLMNTFLEMRHPDYFAEKMPLCLKNHGGSLWLQKLGGKLNS